VNKIEELMLYVNMTGDLIRKRYDEIMAKVGGEYVNSGYVIKQLDRFIILLDRYSKLLSKIKRDFNIEYSDESDDRELLWEIRALDPGKREEVWKFIQSIKKQSNGQ
jgi:hypothetical protein